MMTQSYCAHSQAHISGTSVVGWSSPQWTAKAQHDVVELEKEYKDENFTRNMKKNYVRLRSLYSKEKPIGGYFYRYDHVV